MFFNVDNRSNLLVVDDSFARLQNVLPDGGLEFEFTYSISSSNAIKQLALSVNVEVISRTIKKVSIIDNPNTVASNAKLLVNNVRQQMPAAKSAIKQQDSYVAAKTNSDVMSGINNEVINQLRAGIPTTSIQQSNKPQLKLVTASSLKQSNNIKPVLSFFSHGSDLSTAVPLSMNANTKSLMHDMINRQGLDPTHIFTLPVRAVSPVDAIGGISSTNKGMEIEGSPSSKLVDSFLFHPAAPTQPRIIDEVDDESLVHILVNEPVDDIVIPVSIVIPKSGQRIDGQDVAHFFVKFDVINVKTGVVLDSVSKPLDVSRHVQLFNIPKLPPIVKVVSSELASKANLEIKQVDHGASAVKVYKKTFSRVLTSIDSYSLVGKFDVTSDQQTLLVSIDKPVESVGIYRIVASGVQDTLGFEYTNIVIKPSRFSQIKSLSLTAFVTTTGVQVEAREIPQNVVAIEFLVRNLTTFDHDYRNVGGGLKTIDLSTTIVDHVSVIDKQINPDNVYEYVARLIYLTGESKIVGNVTIEVFNPEPGKVDTTIENVVVGHSDEPNVSFTVNTNIIDTNIDIVKNLLQKQDNYDLFKDDVAKEREFLKSLIAHNVQRVNLTTGVREDFGVVTSSNFSDKDLRKNQAIASLQYGHKYRYEVTALLRAPETMLNTLQKNVTDPRSKKSYSYNPAKFLHPVAMSSKGMLATKPGLQTMFAKDAMSHGAVGSVQTLEISFDDEPARITDPSVSRFDSRLNVVTWKLQGSTSEVDHFIVMKEVNGVRTLVGKTHSEFPYGNCQYLHVIERRDVGEIFYVIVPIFNDYNTGTEAKTNSVII